jgi:hypothetical protein
MFYLFAVACVQDNIAGFGDKGEKGDGAKFRPANK